MFSLNLQYLIFNIGEPVVEAVLAFSQRGRWVAPLILRRLSLCQVVPCLGAITACCVWVTLGAITDGHDLAGHHDWLGAMLKWGIYAYYLHIFTYI